MPNILFKTKVNQPLQKVWAGFDAALFEALKPPFVPMTLLRFDGCKTGDEVHIITAGQRWEAKIVDDWQTDAEVAFVDVGQLLPWPLRNWRHVHRIVADGEGCQIVDDITFGTGSRVLDALLYPLLRAMFGLRRPVYRRLFGG